MDNKSSWSSCTFELADIEIINHKTEHEEKMETWNCDQCNLFYLNKGLLEEHIIKKHSEQDIVKCKYCNKTILFSAVNRECFLNRKCETCEYKCSSCPQRFLRHSSLVNHEKKHSSPKKKRIKSNNKKNNPISAENNVVSKSFKRKLLEVVSSEEKSEKSKVKKNLNMKTKPKKTGNPQVKIKASLKRENPPAKKQKRLSSKTSKLAEEENSYEMSVKSPKRPTPKTYKTSDEKESSLKSKQTTSPTLNTNGLNCENSVNYKPFSCHVCGNTFASDSALLDHIKTHGENADKSFKCKFCGDEFDDIYKMQYHLAICPLAEDELDSSLKQVIPVNFPPKSIPGTPNQRKRGRPKKITEATLNQESSKDDPTTLVNKKGSFRKRKTDVTENDKSLNIPLDSPPSKKLKKFQNKQSLPKSDSKLSRVVGEQVKTLLSDDMAVVSKESTADDIRKKLHHCPFPRCDFKFTREKALLCHMRNHSDDFDDSLKCHKCDIPFDDIHTLRLHINTCKGIKEEKDDDFKRLSCHESSPNRSFQRTKKDFVCHKCGRSYQNEDKLNSHQCLGFENTKHITKTSLRRHKCNVCQEEFQTESEENDHMITHVRKETENCCLKCSNYVKPTSIQKHKCETLPIKSLRFLVELCITQDISSPETINQMLNGTESNSSDELHKEPRDFICQKPNVGKLFGCKIPGCKVPFASKKMCVKHSKSHLKMEKIICSRCSEKFSSKNTLKRHNCKHKKKVFKCPSCSKVFSKRISLAKHLNNNHVKDLSSFECVNSNIISCDAPAFISHLMVDSSGHPVYVNEPNTIKSDSRLYCSIEDKTDGCHISIENDKTNSRKLSLRSRLSCKSTFALSKSRFVNSNSRHIKGRNHYSTRLKCYNLLKYKQTIKTGKESFELKRKCKRLKNKENIPGNCSTEITNHCNTSTLPPQLDQLKNFIKPCYISLVSCESTHLIKPENITKQKTDPYNEVLKNKVYAPQGGRDTSHQALRNGVEEPRSKDEVSDGKHINFMNHEDKENLEATVLELNVKSDNVYQIVEYSNDEFEDSNDAVDTADDLMADDTLKCFICSEVFDSIGILRVHSSVHVL